MEEIEQLHSGHRDRLTETILKAGTDNLNQVQIVEYFLTYIFPRGDVNPLAHKLLNKYETFANIIDAEISDLCTIKGINTRSATKIKLFGEMINYYSSSKMTQKVNLRNTGEFLDLLEQLLRLQSVENLYLFAIDHNFNLIQKRKFDLKKVRSVGITPYDLFNFIASTKLSYLIVAHNHPSGTAQASPDDHDAATYINQLLETFDCKLIDSFIIGKDGIYSENQNAFVRKFATTKNVYNKILQNIDNK